MAIFLEFGEFPDIIGTFLEEGQQPLCLAPRKMDPEEGGRHITKAVYLRFIWAEQTDPTCAYAAIAPILVDRELPAFYVDHLIIHPPALSARLHVGKVLSEAEIVDANVFFAGTFGAFHVFHFIGKHIHRGSKV